MSDERSAEDEAIARAVAAAPGIRRRSRRYAWAFAAVCVGLLPWIAYLAVSLPRRNLEVHYRLAWVGFDVILVVAMARAAYFAFRVDIRIQTAAVMAATLFMVDAWFDVTTSTGRANVIQALVLAVFAELPAAIFLFWLARQVGRHVFELAHLDRIEAGEVPPESASDILMVDPGLDGRPSRRLPRTG